MDEQAGPYLEFVVEGVSVNMDTPYSGSVEGETTVNSWLCYEITSGTFEIGWN